MQPYYIEKTDREIAKLDIAVFCLLGILLFGMGFSPLLSPVSPDLHDSYQIYSQGNIYRQVSVLLVVLLAGLSIMTQPTAQQNVSASGLLARMCILYILFGLMSLAWAETRDISIRRTMALLCLYFGACAFLRRYDAKDLILFILVTAGVTIASGLLYEIYHAIFAPFVDGYRFGGPMHPNNMGAYCSVFLIALFAIKDRLQLSWQKLLALALPVLLLLMLTKSRTTFFALLAALSIRRLVDLSLPRKILFMSLAAWFFCLFLLFSSGDAVTPLTKAIKMGRIDSNISTLTGRTLLWKECLTEYASKRPFMGYGQGGFWTARHLYDVSRSQNWTINNAHSTYIDHVLELGIVGLALYLTIMVMATQRCLACYKAQYSSEHSFFFTFLIFFSLVAVMETVSPGPDYFSFTAMLIVGYVSFNTDNSVVSPSQPTQ